MKLLVSDFDLTFFDSNYENNIKRVNEFVKQGNIFVIATGRPYGLLEHDLHNKNVLYEYLICSDGAVIFDKNNQIIYKNFIDNNISNEIISILEKDPNIERVYIDKNSNSILGVYGLFKNKKEAEILLQKIIHKYEVGGYISLHWLNVLNKDITKVNGIKYLKNVLNIKDGDIYVIGDGINDLTMINEYNGYMIGHENKEKTVKSFDDFMNIINKNSSI